MAASSWNPSEEEEDSARRPAVGEQLSYEQKFIGRTAAVQTVAAITPCATAEPVKESQPPSTEISTVASIFMTVTVCVVAANVGARVASAVGVMV